jgi:hypothetical protein
MRVVLTTIASGPEGVTDIGSVLEVPAAFGAHLVETLHARAATADEKVTARWPYSTEVPKADEPDKPKAK